MYTANTMALASEVMGITLPNSSSNLANSNEKIFECAQAPIIIKKLLGKKILPKDILTIAINCISWWIYQCCYTLDSYS